MTPPHKQISMPVMNGLEATARLRRLGVTVPIIGLTADITKETRDAGIDCEMNDVLLKPFKYRKFMECIAKWVCAHGIHLFAFSVCLALFLD